MGSRNRQDAPEHDKEGTTPCKVNNVFRHCTQLASPGHRSAKSCLLHIPLQQPVLAPDRAAASKPDPRKKQSSKLCCLKIKTPSRCQFPLQGEVAPGYPAVEESFMWLSSCPVQDVTCPDIEHPNSSRLQQKKAKFNPSHTQL